MLRHLSSARWMSLCSAVLLAACGGSGGGAGAPTGGGATPSTTLSISPSALALSVNGVPRHFTITNTGSASAQTVIWAVSTGSPPFPFGTTPLSNCTTLAPGASCRITVTPGAVASSAKGVLSPVPITLSVGSANTNLLSPSVQVVEYGSVYQSGYVFDIDDSTLDAGSIGGKVAALDDIASSPLPWSSTAPSLINASSLTNGQANTQAIVAVLDGQSEPRVNYAAGACAALGNGGYTNWYLPAICEMSSAAAGCAAQPNMQTNLIENSTVAGSPSWHWSSTESALNPVVDGAQHQFAFPGASQRDDSKGTSANVRCVRALTL